MLSIESVYFSMFVIKFLFFSVSFFDRSQGGMHLRIMCGPRRRQCNTHQTKQQSPAQEKQEALNQGALSETMLPLK